ncbi:MAG TPA: RDD family protein [Candidatus Helicobacter avistercoris]|nr:RDD family protein [Candidatus Helicobacter avistercoris]
MNLEEILYREKIELATLTSRVIAFLIDKLLLSFVFTLIYWDSFSSVERSYVQIVGFLNQVIWQYLLLSFAYEAIFTFLYGATLGKIVCKIKVISTSLLDRPSIAFACIRSMVKILGEYLAYAPFFLVFFTPFQQALHDLLGKSIVIKNA